MKKLLLFAENAFAMLGLTFFMGGLTFMFGDSSNGAAESNTVVTAIRYFFWFGSTLLLVFNAKRAVATLRRGGVFWILTILILFSFAWSDFPQEVLLNNREVLQMTSFGLYFATRFDLKQQVRFLAITFFIGIVTSLLVGIGLPAIGRHFNPPHVGAWRGIYGDKNVAGSMMVLASIIFFALPIERPLDRWLKWGGLALATLLILLSTSKTALILALAMPLVLWLYREFRWQGRWSVAVSSLSILILGGATIGLLSNWTALLLSLGRDPTLTGRTYIWRVALTRLLDRPLFGYGRSAFWLPESAPSKEVSIFLPNFVSPHAHNGFIDLALDVGLIGLSLFLICYGMALITALKRAYATQYSEWLWPLGFLVFLALNNMTESFLLRLSTIYWLLFTTVLLTVSQRLPMRSRSREPEDTASQTSALQIRRQN